MPQERFAAQLDVLVEVADIVGLGDVDSLRHDSRPRVAITFDDAYEGAVTAGVDELRARRLPATIFVAPGRLDGHVFWWDAFAGENGELDAGFRRHALDVLGGDDERVRAWAASCGRSANDHVPDFARATTEARLQRATTAPGIVIGAHSWSHPSLSSLTEDALDRELTRPLQWITERFGGRSVRWLAYPYGIASPAVRERARRAGYDAAVDITGGWHRPDEVPSYGRPRLTVGSGMSIDGFRARVLGALPTG